MPDGILDRQVMLDALPNGPASTTRCSAWRPGDVSYRWLSSRDARKMPVPTLALQEVFDESST